MALVDNAETVPQFAALMADAPCEGEADVALDRSKFVKRVRVQALRVPKGACHQLVKKLSKFKAEYPKVRNVIVEESRPETRLILLGESLSGPDLAELPASLAAELKADPDVEITEHEIVLDYDTYTADQVLRELLPPGTEVPSSFETIGHVAHVNLRDELLPYKKIIGEVLLEKNFPRIRTVLNKVGTIENEFRVPTFEVLAGDPCTVTEVKQHTARFQLDYAQVYWNSRLEFEHARLVDQFARDDVICDMFAGIGPFAIPAALKGCAVYANDLNPQSTHYLAINAKLNKVPHRIRISTLDAREYVRLLVRPLETDHVTAPGVNSPPEGGQASEPPNPAIQPGKNDGSIPESGGGRNQETEGPSSCPPENIAERSGRKSDAEGAHASTTGVSEAQSSRGKGNGAVAESSSGRNVLPASMSGEGQPAGSRERAHNQTANGGPSKGDGGGGGSAKEAPKRAVGKGGKPAMLRPPKEPVPERPRKIDHVVMNLPASGIEFLDVFNGLFGRAWWNSPLPRIHCYCFARAFETDADVIRRAEEALGGAISDPIVWNVRDVAPNKTMLCVSFTLPDEVGYDLSKDGISASQASPPSSSQPSEATSNEASLPKKSRVE